MEAISVTKIGLRKLPYHPNPLLQVAESLQVWMTIFLWAIKRVWNGHNFLTESSKPVNSSVHSLASALMILEACV